MRRGFAIFCFLMTAGQAQAVDANAVQRMTDVAHLWSDVKWSSPALASGEVDWDQALVDALPKIQAASTPAAFQDAVTALMKPLHDPAFQVFTVNDSNYVSEATSQELLEWLPGEVALLHLHRLASMRVNSGEPDLGAVTRQLAGRAKGLIIDLRPTKESASYGYGAEFPDDLITSFIEQPLQLPSNRYRYHTGFPAEMGNSTGGYFSANLLLQAARLMPALDAHAIPMVFIVNRLSGVPLSALALQRAGKAWILAEGQASAAWAVPIRAVQLSDDGKTFMNYSVGELIFADGTSGFGVDASVAPNSAAGADSPAAKAALTLIGSGGRPGSTATYTLTSATAAQQIVGRSVETRFPSLPRRQLAVIKLWSTMDKFFPYLTYTDRPWDDALPEFLARMKTVSNSHEYALAIAEMAARLNDSHVWIQGPERASLYGEAPVGVRLASVENRIAIVEITDPELQKNAQLVVGDVVVAVDGEDIAQRISQLEKITSGSTEAARLREVLPCVLAGANGSTAKVLIEDAAGARREVLLPRSLALWKFRKARRTGDVVKILPGNIGYADLDRLELKDVDVMFDAIKGTNALILDMRGYPHGTAWGIAPRLNVKGAKFGANFSRRVVTALPGEENSLNTFRQLIPKSDQPLYKGKVVMLIDQTTQSQAEHSGLLFESATAITFIGSPSAGANGDLTKVVLPGAIAVTFSGQEVRHADGRQLQRIGLQPDIKVVPTLNGIRAGRDEVLERAIEFLTAH